MSIISSQGGFLIGCRECDSPDCRGCNIYRLAEALGQGKLNWMMDKKHCVHVPDMEGGNRMKSFRLTKTDFGTLCICALRYCYGRETYMPDLVRGIVRPFLRDLEDRELSVMIDDYDFYKRVKMLGDDHIDRPGWERWENELQAERARRKDGTE